MRAACAILLLCVSLLLSLEGCASGAVQAGPGYCPPPFRVDATGFCAAVQQNND